jgi:putative Mn2+ efflux pump MntP
MRTGVLAGMVSEHWQAILIAAASSTDNFLVGISVGLSVHRNNGGRSMRGLIWGIAICNAITALATVRFGEQIGAVFSPALQNSAAGFVFLSLAWHEVRGGTDRAEAKNKNAMQSSQWTLLVQLAIPMSLNNMAGGVASGVAGVSASLASIYALLASVWFMESGVYLGRRWRWTTTKGHHHDQLPQRAMFWNCALYILLGFQCFYNALI